MTEIKDTASPNPQSAGKKVLLVTDGRFSGGTWGMVVGFPLVLLGAWWATRTPAAASLRKELEGRFLLALEQMEEGDRDLLLMRHFEGLTNGEVAELLGLSPSAAGNTW